MLNVRINSFTYTDKPVLQHIDFSLEQGKHLFVLGESGCGKSTLLQLIYGLLHLENGEIFWGEKKLLGPEFNLIPGAPFIKYLAQDFDLMPFISVADNIGKHLTRRFMDKRQQRIDELLEVVDMEAYADVHVKNLSGGQKQRVALARAIAKEPELLLLDEPFSHIDNFRRHALRRKLYAYLKKENITCITATHDSEEALSFAEEIKIMRKGTFVQSGTPEAIFKSPKDAYVASFFGDVSSFSLDKMRHVLLPHQFKITDQSGDFNVEVLQSYYKGNFYLVEGVFENQLIYFQSPTEIHKGSTVAIKILI
ncbi:MAG: ABC transporter ATP-binding protein [Leeuwenhoekiella sp.]